MTALMKEAKALGSYRSGPGWTSKAWIAPDGKVFSFGQQHYHWALADAQRLKNGYGVDLTRVPREDDPIRVAMLRAGFARVNYEHCGGLLIVEVLSRQWKGPIKRSYFRLVIGSLDAVYSINLQLLNDKMQIVHRDYVKLVQYGDREKAARIPMGSPRNIRWRDRVRPRGSRLNLIIRSGGQNGADKAGLDHAIETGIRHCGWCPKGRKAEDGVIGPEYRLKETPTANYIQRTEWNVRDSDGTVIFSIGKKLLGGSRKTLEFARRDKKPVLHLSAGTAGQDAARLLKEFIRLNRIRVLNVAGSRESKEPGVYQFVRDVLKLALPQNANA